ncbi:hypothetical protein ACFL9T_12340 [Thermodesulfobacteriota bacterium]
MKNPGGGREDTLRRWLWVALFALAFAWVESSVVVYLREIYYGGSFTFPIVTDWAQGKLLVDDLMKIELGREIATILMLVAVGCAAGKRGLDKFCFFMMAFGIWDIFYYVWLWVMIGWPESLLTWDLLFLIPLPWVGPVITPVLIALAMMAAGSLIIFYQQKGIQIHWRWFDWVIIMGCALLMVVAFCWDWKNIMRIPDGGPYDGLPNPFAWWLYLPAYLFSLVYFGWRFKQILTGNR